MRRLRRTALRVSLLPQSALPQVPDARQGALARRAELLPVPYYHLVFTLPHELNVLAQGKVLHTWGQTLTQHLHVHALVAAGALSESGTWVRSRRGFLFPVKALSVVFRGKFLEALAQALGHGRLALSAGTAALSDLRVQRSFPGPIHHRAARARSTASHALRPCVDPRRPLCHSAPIAICAPARNSPRSCTAHRAHHRFAHSIQFPSTAARALNPAVQSN